MSAFVDEHREVHGVGPICKVLQIAPSGLDVVDQRERACRKRQAIPTASVALAGLIAQALRLFWSGELGAAQKRLVSAEPMEW